MISHSSLGVNIINTQISLLKLGPVKLLKSIFKFVIYLEIQFGVDTKWNLWLKMINKMIEYWLFSITKFQYLRIISQNTCQNVHMVYKIVPKVQSRFQHMGKTNVILTVACIFLEFGKSNIQIKKNIQDLFPRLYICRKSLIIILTRHVTIIKLLNIAVSCS